MKERILLTVVVVVTLFAICGASTYSIVNDVVIHSPFCEHSSHSFKLTVITNDGTKVTYKKMSNMDAPYVDIMNIGSSNITVLADFCSVRSYCAGTLHSSIVRSCYSSGM